MKLISATLATLTVLKGWSCQTLDSMHRMLIQIRLALRSLKEMSEELDGQRTSKSVFGPSFLFPKWENPIWLMPFTTSMWPEAWTPPPCPRNTWSWFSTRADLKQVKIGFRLTRKERLARGSHTATMTLSPHKHSQRLRCWSLVVTKHLALGYPAKESPPRGSLAKKKQARVLSSFSSLCLFIFPCLMAFS